MKVQVEKRQKTVQIQASVEKSITCAERICHFDNPRLKIHLSQKYAIANSMQNAAARRYVITAIILNDKAYYYKAQRIRPGE